MLSYSPIVLLYSFIFGAVLGSFLNVCIYRLPREISIISPSSHCTSCGAPISLYHIIPILSYILLRGRCSSCGSSISLTYLIVEILSGILTVIVVRSFGLSLETIFYLYLLYSLIIVTFIDLEHMIIPNVITIPGIVVGILYGVISTDWNYFADLIRDFSFDLRNIIFIISEVPVLDSLLGTIFGGGFLLIIGLLYKLTRKREGMGMGDVKLLAMIGAFWGWKSIIYVSLISSLFGTIIGIAIVLYKKDDLKYAIPFGPFLSIGAFFYLLAVGFNLRLP